MMNKAHSKIEPEDISKVRLFAAAPDMLRALKAVASSYASHQVYDKSALPLVLEAISLVESPVHNQIEEKGPIMKWYVKTKEGILGPHSSDFAQVIAKAVDGELFGEDIFAVTEIKMEMEGGVIHNVSPIPSNIRLIVHEYDIEGADDTKVDILGNEYIEYIYCPGSS